MLAPEDLATVQRFVEGAFERLAAIRVDLTVETDFEAFAANRRGVADGLVYPTFDPRHSSLSSGAFWLRAADRSGRTVATSAAKVFDAPDFFELVRSERLWFDKGPRLVGPTPVVECAIPPFGGRVCHQGGTWVHPDRRGLGLAATLTALSRALMLRNHGIDFDTGVVSEASFRSRLAEVAYRYPRVEICVAAYEGFAGYPEPVYLCHMTRAEALGLMREGADGQSREKVRRSRPQAVPAGV
jgi:GNAT superfamily N-acetyltransferase